MPIPVNREASGTATSQPAAPLLHLSSRDVPPGGLSFKIAALTEHAPRDAWVGPFNDSDTLTAEVNKREKANGIPPSSRAVIEDQICQRLPPGYCRDANQQPTRAPGNFSLTLSEVISGTMALLRWCLHGSVPVEQIVARSYRCNDCPENRPIRGCTGCAATSLYKIINKIVARPLPSDAVLDACFACKCSLKAKVRMQIDDVQKSMTPDVKARLWDRCWILAEEEGNPLVNDPRS